MMKEDIEARFSPRDLESTHKTLQYTPVDYLLPNVADRKTFMPWPVALLGFPKPDKSSYTPARSSYKPAQVIATIAEEAENGALDTPVAEMVLTEDNPSATAALSKRAAGPFAFMDRRRSSMTAHASSKNESKDWEPQSSSCASFEEKIRAPATLIDLSCPFTSRQAGISSGCAVNVKETSGEDLSRGLLRPSGVDSGGNTRNRIPKGHAGDRPETPNSMVSVQEARTLGMLQSIWRLLREAWIGGFFEFLSELFRRHDS
jgi:hypothetical protein